MTQPVKLSPPGHNATTTRSSNGCNGGGDDASGASAAATAASFLPSPTSPTSPLMPLAPSISLDPPRSLGIGSFHLQTPLSRRGVGPGLIVILPPRLSMRPHARTGLRTPLDPEPVQKWAEEGFAVVGGRITGDTDVSAAMATALAALEECSAVEPKSRYAVLVYDPSALPSVLAASSSMERVVAVVAHGAAAMSEDIPMVAHVPSRIVDSESEPPPPPNCKLYVYAADSPYFAVPSAGPKAYSAPDASLAHTRSLVFLREQLGGPYFDLEAVWDEHTHYEFVDRSVAKTMATMVAQPYVNHVPTMTGGVGREELIEFYRDHFIFSNPDDVNLTVVSRTVGADRVVDEFIYSCTHSRAIDWLLPGVPATGRAISLPMVAVVNIRGDRLYHEHIWWDQASALQQVGLLPESMPCPGGRVRLPVAADASAAMLVNETAVEANFMFGPDWGVHPARTNGCSANEAPTPS